MSLIIVIVKIISGVAMIINADLSSPSDIRFEIENRDNYHEISRLSIKDTFIPVLNNEILKHFPNLQTISCSNCTIKEISNDAFHALKYLEEIDFQGCKIQAIAENAFNTNQALEKINLNSNLLENLPKTLFYHLVNLQILDLSDNKLKEIDVDGFKHLYKLQYLSVNDNFLLEFNLKKVFEYSPFLRTVGIYGNAFHFDSLLNMIKLKNKFGISLLRNTNDKRARDYPVLLIGGIDCVDEETFAKLVAKRDLEDAGQLVKDFDLKLKFDEDL